MLNNIWISNNCSCIANTKLLLINTDTKLFLNWRKICKQNINPTADKLCAFCVCKFVAHSQRISDFSLNAFFVWSWKINFSLKSLVGGLVGTSGIKAHLLFPWQKLVESLTQLSIRVFPCEFVKDKYVRCPTSIEIFYFSKQMLTSTYVEGP